MNIEINSKMKKMAFFMSIFIILVFIVGQVPLNSINFPSRKDQPFKNIVEFKETNKTRIDYLSSQYALLPDNKAMFVSNEDDKVYVVDLNSLKIVKSSLFISDGKDVKLKEWNGYILMFLEDGSIYYFDKKTKRITKDIYIGSGKWIFAELYNQYAILSDGDKVVLVDLVSGKSLYNIRVYATINSIEVYKGYIIINKRIDSSESGYNVYVHDLETFKEIWHYVKKTDAHGHSVITTFNDTIVFSDFEETLFFDLPSGKIIDKNSFQADKITLIGESILYIAQFSEQDDFDFFSTDLKGNILWKQPAIYGHFYNKKNYAFVLTNENELSKINLHDGSVIWKVENPDLSASNVVPTDSYDVIESFGGNLFIIDNQTKKLIWRYDFISDDTANRFWFVQNQKLYLYDEGYIKVYAL